MVGDTRSENAFYANNIKEVSTLLTDSTWEIDVFTGQGCGGNKEAVREA